MTDEELATIKARADAATYGPWETDDATWSIVLRDRPLPVVYGNAHYGIPVDHDAAFIAHAREDIPALLAEVERLRADLKDVTDRLIRHINRLQAMGAEVEAWRAVGREVADGRLYYSDQPQGWICNLCGAWTHDEWGSRYASSESESDRAKRVIRHDADCPVSQARALLDH